MGEEMTATQAPMLWSVDMESVGRQWTNSVSIKDADGGHVAHLTRGYEGSEGGDGSPSWENAHLIAAAPDLLAACEAALHRLKFLCKCEESSGCANAKLRSTIRSAMAKAKGENP